MRKPVTLALLCAVVLAPQCFSQTPAEIIKAKTEARLRDVLSGVQGIVGYAAVDFVKGERFAANEHMQFPQASAIKIPVLMEVYKQAHEGTISLNDKLSVGKARQVGGSGVLNEFGDNTSAISVADLCVLMIVLSDNSATNILIDLVGMHNVNKTLQTLGITRTRLQRRMMDQAASIRGEENISTPADALKIMEYLYKGEFVNRRVSDQILSVLKKGKGSGALQSAAGAGVPVAFKPGGISGVATEWGIVYLEGFPYGAALMMSFASGDEADATLRSVARILHDYYSRIARATPYGTYGPAPK